MKKILDHVPMFGLTHVFHHDEETGLSTITAEQEDGFLVDENQKMFNDNPGKTGWGDGSGTHVARIPLVVLNDLFAKGIAQDTVAMKVWLNQSENAKYRVRGGTV